MVADPVPVEAWKRYKLDMEPYSTWMLEHGYPDFSLDISTVVTVLGVNGDLANVVDEDDELFLIQTRFLIPLSE